MSQHNQFAHQSYDNVEPTCPYFLIDGCIDEGTAADRMRDAGKRLVRNRVKKLFLIHGTFVGNDAFGILEHLSSVVPSLSADLREISKRWVDQLTGDVANYTKEAAKSFDDSLGAIGVVDLGFTWSSENSHLGRAHAAVTLLDRLLRLELDPDDRIMLWGHSHGGNVFAILSNLLANEHESCSKFLEIGQGYFRDHDEWTEVRAALEVFDGPHPLAKKLDIVTFGTPVRYGWDRDGYTRLLHFVHHRTADGLPDYRTPAPLPQKLSDILNATYGDWVQTIGIAGTNTSPTILEVGKYRANIPMKRLLESGLSGINIMQLRNRWGIRIPHEGTTLLVDYDAESDLMGHGVYTKKVWLPFHIQEVLQRFGME